MSVREAIESGDLHAFVLSLLDALPTSSRAVSPELVGGRDGMFRGREEALSALEASS
jgi:hypothetical protein